MQGGSTERLPAAFNPDIGRPSPCLPPPAPRLQGSAVSIVQDLPISKPLVPSDIDRVAQAKAITTYAPLYLDLASGGDRLQAVIERMKPIGTVLRLVTCKVTRARARGGNASAHSLLTAGDLACRLFMRVPAVNPACPASVLGVARPSTPLCPKRLPAPPS